MTKLKTIVAAVASLVIFTNIAHAQTATSTNYQANYAEPLTVKYLGSEGDYLYFEVSLKPQTEGKAKFEIVDKNEGAFYAAGVSNDFKVKTYKVEKREDQVLDFRLHFGKKTYSKTFSINTSLVENTTVAAGDITKL